MSYAESEVIKRVFKLGYAMTSYQECPNCQQHVQKGTLHVINERVIRYPVVNKIVKQFYHIDCYDMKCLIKNQNIFLPLEKVEGFQEIKEVDIKRVQSVFANLVIKIKAAPSHLTRESDSDQNKSIERSNGLSKQRIEDFFEVQKKTHSNSNGNPSPRQKTLHFSSKSQNFSNMIFDIDKQKEYRDVHFGGKQINKKQNHEYQSKQEILRFGKKQQNEDKERCKRVFAIELDDSESSSELLFEPKGLVQGKQRNECEFSNRRNQFSNPVISTSEKVEQLRKRKASYNDQLPRRDQKNKKIKFNGEIEKRRQKINCLDFDSEENDSQSKENQFQKPYKELEVMEEMQDQQDKSQYSDCYIDPNPVQFALTKTSRINGQDLTLSDQNTNKFEHIQTQGKNISKTHLIRSQYDFSPNYVNAEERIFSGSSPSNKPNCEQNNILEQVYTPEELEYNIQQFKRKQINQKPFQEQNRERNGKMNEVEQLEKNSMEKNQISKNQFCSQNQTKQIIFISISDEEEQNKYNLLLDKEAKLDESYCLGDKYIDQINENQLFTQESKKYSNQDQDKGKLLKTQNHKLLLGVNLCSNDSYVSQDENKQESPILSVRNNFMSQVEFKQQEKTKIRDQHDSYNLQKEKMRLQKQPEFSHVDKQELLKSQGVKRFKLSAKSDELRATNVISQQIDNIQLNKQSPKIIPNTFSNSRQLKQLANYSRQQLIDVLNKNGYTNLKELNYQWLMYIASDGLTRGSIPPCNACNVGQLIFNQDKNIYICNGSQNNGCQQTYLPHQIHRNIWIQ